LLSAEALKLIVMACLSGFSAFFSGAETAFFSLPGETRRRFASSKKPSERLTAHLLQNPQNLLVTLLLGNLIVNLLFYTLSASVAISLVDAGREVEAVAWGVGSLLYLVIFGEISPKTISLRYAEGLSSFASSCIYLLQKVFWPVTAGLGALVKVFLKPIEGLSLPPQGLTSRELRVLMELSRQQGLINREQEEMLTDVLHIARLKARDVLVPRSDIVSYPENGPIEGLLKLARKTGHARIPIYRATLDQVIGMVDVKEIHFFPGKPLKDYIRPVPFVPETKRLESLLRFFRDEKIKVAMVVDEYGQTAGMVTLEDAVEEIVGEIQDEFEKPEELVRPLGKNRYLLSGKLSIRDWDGLFGIGWTNPRVSTIAGLIVSLLGHIPSKGEKVEYGNVRFTVEEVSGRRISRVVAEHIKPARKGAKSK